MALKTLKNHAADRKKKIKVNKRAQGIIPITESLGDGLFKSDGSYMKTYAFENINFKLLSKDQETGVLSKWFEFLNILEPGATYKYVVMKQKLDVKNYKKERMLPYRNDDKDHYRKEYNDMLEKKVFETNQIKEDRYFQAIYNARKERDAIGFFTRSEPEFEKMFTNLNSTIRKLTDREYLKIMWNFLHPESEDFFDQLELPNKSSHIKSFLSPYSYKTNHSESYIKIGNKYMRSLYVPPNAYAKYIKDTVIDELTSLEKTLSIAVDIMPIETVEAYKMVENLEFKSESNLTKYIQRQNKAGNFNAQPPYSMRKKAEQIEEYNNDLNERDQRLMLGNITITHIADSLDELNDDTETLKTLARKQGCELSELTLEEENGLITSLPFGTNRFINKTGSKLRTFTTEAMAAFIPFTVQEVMQKNGIYYGQNLISENPIFINRKERMNGNAVILGSSGSGKSFKKKEEMLNVILNTDDKIIIIDPEKEYTHLVQEMGGTVIKMSADSTDHINAMEIDSSYNDGADPTSLKSESILTLYAMAEGSEELDSGAKSVIDRCVKSVCRDFVMNGYKGEQPTLLDLREELLKQPEDIAQKIALTLELYTTGSLNLFSKHTNVDMTKRIISFDISELGDNLMSIAMLIITDFIMLTLSRNRKSGIYTWVDLDELYLMFLKEYTAIFFYKLWKRIRKYGGLCTGITQELSDLLKSSTARTLLANSDFLIMLSASESDVPLIQDLLNLDDTQMSYIAEVGAKKGLIKLGKSYIPFTDDFPTDTKLYKIISTKFNEE